MLTLPRRNTPHYPHEYFKGISRSITAYRHSGRAISDPGSIPGQGVSMAEETKSIIVENLPALQNVQSIEVELKGLSRDMVHMASCFQEMNARLEEFMKNQEERVRVLETNCNREERWGLNKTDHDLVWAEINKHDARISVLEKGKCPRAAQFTELDKRVADIEKTHQIDAGQTKAFMSTREMAMLAMSVTLGLITIYSFVRGN